MILGELRQKGVLTEAESSQALAEMPGIGGMQRKVDKSFAGKVRQFFRDLFGVHR